MERGCGGVGRVTATVYLIRHAAHGHIGHTLSGRQPGLALTEEGREQAARLGQVLAVRFAAVHASPVQRARETAAMLGEIQLVPALEEVDFGDWTGKRFDELAGDPDWQRWNEARSTARCPGGESMTEAQARIVAHVTAAAERFPGAELAMVTHSDMVKAALAHWLGLSLDCILNFDIDPASVSRVAVGGWGGRVLSINERLS